MSAAVIIDYDSGNLHSAEKAFARVGRDLGVDVSVTADPEAVRRADWIVLPGVGAFGDCAAGLRAVAGMVEALEERVVAQGRPFMGVCVGMQLMAEVGRERGAFDGLGWLPGVVDAVAPDDPSLKIPHMGWNRLEPRAVHPVLDGLGRDPYVYFVHSYAMSLRDPACVLATAEYGGPLNAVVGRDNLVGTQFHPEKSQRAGQALISGFLRWRP